MSAEIKAEVKGRNIFLDTPYKYKNLCKSISGRRWDAGKKKWKYPKSPATAVQIYRQFKDVNGKLKTDKGFRELLELAKQVGSVQKYKEMGKEELPPVEHSNLPSWEHQLQAYHFSKDLHAGALFMDMGTGKSKVVIDIINYRGHSKVLVVCPLSVVDVWPAELQKHSPREFKQAILNKYGVKGKKEHAEQKLAEASASNMPFIAVINYESVWREPFRKWCLHQDWDLVVADESHRIKSPGAKCSLYMNRLGKRVDHRMCLTGTPLANNPLDIYGQYRFLDPGIFGTSFNRFKQKYAIMGGYGGYEIMGYQNEPEFNKRMYSIAYRCEADEVLDLPEKMTLKRYCTLEKEGRKHYQSIKKAFYTQIEKEEVTALNALTKLLRLQQITSGFINTDEDRIKTLGKSKQNLFREVLQDIPDGEPVVAFARFRYDLRAMKEIAIEEGYTPCELSGSSNSLKEFQAGKYDFIAVQISSGGVGIDLTRANYAIYYSLGFSLKDYQQSRARLHRPGQDSTVRFIELLARDSVDEKVEASLANKQDVVDYILEEITEKLAGLR